MVGGRSGYRNGATESRLFQNPPRFCRYNRRNCRSPIKYQNPLHDRSKEADRQLICPIHDVCQLDRPNRAKHSSWGPCCVLPSRVSRRRVTRSVNRIRWSPMRNVGFRVLQARSYKIFGDELPKIARLRIRRNFGRVPLVHGHVITDVLQRRVRTVRGRARFSNSAHENASSRPRERMSV